MVGGLTLALFLSLLFVWPSLRDVWYVQRLRTEESFLETALLDTTTCPPSAVDGYLKTDQGKASLSKLFVRVAESCFSHSSKFYAAKNFRRAIFLVHGESVFYSVLTNSRGSSATGSTQDESLLQALRGHLVHLDGLRLS